MGPTAKLQLALVIVTLRTISKTIYLALPVISIASILPPLGSIPFKTRQQKWNAV